MTPVAATLVLTTQATEVTEVCGIAAPSGLARFVCERTGSTLWTGAAEWLVGKPLKIVFVLVLAWLGNRLARRGIRRLVTQMQDPETRARLGRFRERARINVLSTDRIPSLRQAQRAEAMGAVLRSSASVVIWAVALVTVLAELNVAIGPMIASAGIVGVALGFGAQSTVKDFLAGVFMLLEDQYGVGDIIDVGEATGVVEGLSLRSTRIRSVDGTLWHVPNGEIRRVGNMSQEWARALLDISVAYDTDLDRASAIIKDVADQMWREEAYERIFLEEPAVWGVQTLAADGIDIRLVIKTKPGEQWSIGRELRRRIKDRFDAEGIEIPFPQRTVWHRDADGKPRAKKATRKSSG
ncbi:MAG TPA: mechanosensitive ion channel family protein [Nitriliruptorales bacterium]